jgi:SWI/SNF-related matrix-associated actin-dependent regulator 1 of chromatin subfamily A
MSAVKRNFSFKARYFYMNKNNDKKKNRNSVSNPKDKYSFKQSKISFQLIDKDKVEINATFFMPPQIISILKEHKINYNIQTKTYQLPFKIYPLLYKELDKLLHDSEYKELPEFKVIDLSPIPMLPLEVSTKAEEINYIKYRETITKSNKKSTKEIKLDFTKDPQKSIDSLSGKFLQALYDFQKDGIKFGIERKGRILLADEMGVGKTVQAIGIALMYKEEWPVLIICPSSLKFVWRDEILKWIPDINDDKINIQIFKSSKDYFKCGVKIYIMSYDLTVKLEDKITEKNFKFIIADEAHYMKSPDAKRTKCLMPIIKRSKRVILITGTPILAKPVELYPLLTMLRPDLFHNFKEFGNRYCDPKRNFFGMDWTGSSNPKELNYILRHIMIRRLKKEVMNQLPPKKRQKVEIQTDPKVIKQIQAINLSSEKIIEKINELNNSQINPNLVNYVNPEKPEDNNENLLNLFNKVYNLSAEAKISGVKEYIHYLIDNKCKFLIFAHHMKMLDGIEEEVKKLKVDYIRIDGKVKLEKRQEYVYKYQHDETCLVAILSITACYTGITLTAASTVVFSELHMTPAVMIQAEDRAHRIGQEHECVNIHYLYGPDTIDEVLFRMLNQKQNIFSNTLDNMVKNMEVKNTYKKVGDFLKGKNDLDVNINNKKLIVTESGNKNMTLNNFVFIKNNKEENDKDTSTCVNEESINNVNLHKNQTRRKIEKISDKNNNKKDDSIDIEENNIIDNDDEITNPFIKAQLEDIDIEEDNNPTKIKSKNKNIKDNKKNSEKIPFKTILDFFN